MLKHRTGFSAALLLALATAGAAALSAQERGSVVGTVVSEAGLLPMEGVLVQIEGTTNRTVTDEKGRFEFHEVPVGEMGLRVERMGHVTLTEVVDLTPGEVALVRFRLTSIAGALEELVVHAHADPTARDSIPRDRGFAEGRVHVVEDAVSMTAADLLEQAVPGLSIIRGSGLSGSGVGVRIRGVNSLTLSDGPAVYVDGVRIGSKTLGSRGNQQTLHALQMIPAHHVKWIRVLRGPAASTEFPEAKGGVILVETRK